MIFRPREYQRLALDFMVPRPRANLFASPGTGKTGTSYELFCILKMAGEARHALVLAPKRVAMSAWPDERSKWLDSFGHLSVGVAIGTEKQRIEVLKRMPDIVCINYDMIEWLCEVLSDQWYFDTVFADESPRLKGLRLDTRESKAGNQFERSSGSKRAGRIAKVAWAKVRRWYNLTGSPCPNGLVDTWGQQWFIDGGQALGSTFGAFQQRWFRPQRTDYGAIYLPNEFSDVQIQAAMKPTSLTIDARDWFDLKDVVETNIMVDLPPKARRHYDELQRELFTEIEDTPVAVFNSASKSNKCLQVGNGAVYVDDDRNVEFVHDAKIEALRSIVTETNGAPLLIRYEYQSDRDRILKAFPRFKFLDSPATVAAFQRGELAGLVTHAASAGHGLSLQDHCWILVDYTTSYNLEHDEQIIERIGPTRQAQSGLDRVVFRYRLIARDTIEESVCLPVIKKKMGVQEAFKAAMKREKRVAVC